MKYVLLLVCAASVLRCAQWTRIASANFELYTTSTDDEARRTLETFEQTREFFLRTKSFFATPRMPVALVAFNTAREYKPYSPKDAVLAYFTQDGQRDYIVMSDLGAERTRIAIHEYVHVLVQHSGLQIPLWLNEGLAEVYSGMRVRDGKILVGNIPDDRAYSLGSGNWMRIGSLFSVSAQSAEYNEKTRIGMFYAQSCLLAHMLMLGDGYADKFPAFVDRVHASGSSQKAFAEVYGKSAAEVEKDMLAYFRQSTIGGATYETVTKKVDPSPAQQPTDLQVGLLLARLMGSLGRFEEARSRLEQLSAAHPRNREIEEARAYLAWRSGDQDTALQRFEQAFTYGGSAWTTYWDYAQLLHLAKGNPARKIEALEKALALKPELAPARLMLARELYAHGRLPAALSELRQIRIVEAQQALDMYVSMAHLAAALKVPEEARRYVEQAKTYARRPEETARVEAVLRGLKNASDDSSAGVAASEMDNDEKRPILRRRNPPKQRPRTR